MLDHFEEEFEDHILDPGPDTGHDQKQVPIFGFDPGWLFLISGLVLLAATILLPPADDLVELEYKQELIAVQEDQAVDRLEAYTNFLEALDNEDPVLVRRLAVTNLNRIPANSEPVAIIGSDLDASVDRWIASTLPVSRDVAVPELKDSFLRRICSNNSGGSSSSRLWVIGLSAVLIMIGLMPGAASKVTGKSN